jgi:hypothetical protein
MPELILSDITVMGPGYCVIGLERDSSDSYRSVRPRPPWGFAWREPFPFKRGDRVRCQLRPTAGLESPHLEDMHSNGLIGTGVSLTEDELVGCLRLAEVSTSLEGLFGCELKSANDWAPSWVPGETGARSICGCLYTNIRFSVTQEPDRLTLRAQVVLPSRERRNNIPVVDREWKRFLQTLMSRLEGAEAVAKAKQFLNGPVRMRLLRSAHSFARLGLARPGQDGKCWLMLDSLFPQPNESWMDLL